MQKLKPKDRLKITKDGIEYEFEVAKEGRYVVSVPELPGCVSEGDTFEEAWEMIQDAMEGWPPRGGKARGPYSGEIQGSGRQLMRDCNGKQAASDRSPNAESRLRVRR